MVCCGRNYGLLQVLVAMVCDGLEKLRFVASGSNYGLW